VQLGIGIIRSVLHAQTDSFSTVKESVRQSTITAELGITMESALNAMLVSSSATVNALKVTVCAKPAMLKVAVLHATPDTLEITATASPSHLWLLLLSITLSAALRNWPLLQAQWDQTALLEIENDVFAGFISNYTHHYYNANYFDHQIL